MKRNTEEKTLQMEIIRQFRATYTQYIWYFTDENKKQQTGQRLMAGLTGVHIRGTSYQKGNYIKSLKEQGFVVGEPDLKLPMRSNCGKFMGLYIELKVGKNKQRKSQIAFQDNAEKMGHKYIICRTAKECMEAIKFYVGH